VEKETEGQMGELQKTSVPGSQPNRGKKSAGKRAGLATGSSLGHLNSGLIRPVCQLGRTTDGGLGKVANAKQKTSIGDAPSCRYKRRQKVSRAGQGGTDEKGKGGWKKKGERNGEPGFCRDWDRATQQALPPGEREGFSGRCGMGEGGLNPLRGSGPKGVRGRRGGGSVAHRSFLGPPGLSVSGHKEKKKNRKRGGKGYNEWAKEKHGWRPQKQVIMPHRQNDAVINTKKRGRLRRGRHGQSTLLHGPLPRPNLFLAQWESSKRGPLRRDGNKHLEERVEKSQTKKRN